MRLSWTLGISFQPCSAKCWKLFQSVSLHELYEMTIFDLMLYMDFLTYVKFDFLETPIDIKFVKFVNSGELLSFLDLKDAIIISKFLLKGTTFRVYCCQRWVSRHMVSKILFGLVVRSQRTIVRKLQVSFYLDVRLSWNPHWY